MKINFARIKKAAAAGAGALLSELTLVLMTGGEINEASVGAGLALAVATGWAAYQAKNRLNPTELREQLREALRRDGEGE